jgi:uncharacterized membrane protein YeaQ/YmgE (transglycosylase-associated protein family)
MNQIYTFLIGIFVLIVGFPIGIILSHVTKDESDKGQFWFKLIILASLVGAVITLIWRNDALFFTFLFFMVVTSQSLKR